MKHIRYNRNGFSLTEALVALTILSIAATGVLIPFSNAARVHAEGMRRTVSAKLAADLTEEICVTNYDSIISTWNGYTESEGNITMTGNTVKFTGDAYKFLSRSANCMTASIGSGDNTTTLGIWVIVVVNYHGMEITRLSTLVSR